MTTKLSERLKSALDRPGLSQAGLARACGIKPASVSNWLSGRTKKMMGENLLNAARYLGVSSTWLADGRGS